MEESTRGWKFGPRPGLSAGCFFPKAGNKVFSGNVEKRMKTMFLKILGGLLAVLLVTGTGVYWIATGPQNLDQYPPAATSPNWASSL